LAYDHTVAFFQHHHVQYYPSNAGFFLMVNLSTPAGITEGMGEEEGRKRETDFVDRLIDSGVFVAPGGQYHHPKPGWFRFTFSMQPRTLKLALRRTEKAMKIKDEDSFEEKRPLLDLQTGSTPVPGGAGKASEGEKRKSWLQKLVSS